MMKFSFLIIFMSIFLATAYARCYTDNSSGVPLPPHYNAEGTIACVPGFVCKQLDPNDASTYPVFCPPSNDCLEDRAFGTACDPQGDFEPYMVPAGYFSVNGSVVEECPSGSFCPAGSQFPKKCPALTYCPAGQARKYHYGVFVFLLLSLILLAAITKFYRVFLTQSALLEDVPEDGEGFNLASRTNSFLSRSFSGSSASPGSTTPTSAMSPQDRSKKVQLLCDGFKRRRGGTRPLLFQFHNLRVAVPLEGGEKKVLLNDVSGSFAPGKVTAIMGPSGAGKTTLMNTLLGKMPAHITQSGELLVNGEPTHISKVRHMIGFVPQDDILHTELSTYKNLFYSSEIRLPRDWNEVERHLFRSVVTDIMDLSACRDIPVGDEFERGISKSQRKRASIGLELVAAPLAMFLDEPTSGLDSFASMELCLLLREIALQTHLCVAMVIHQPRAEIWNTLDEVLILAPGGYTVYQGPQSEAQAYFEGVGVEFSFDANPADTIMDAVAERTKELIDAWMMYTGEAPLSPSKDVDVSLVGEDDGHIVWPGASIPRQLVLSHNRSVEKQLSIMQPFIIEIFVAALCGLILGQANIDEDHTSTYRAPYQQLSFQPFETRLPQLNLYALTSLSLAGATAGVRVLSEPMKNYYRETAAGHSRVAFYLGALWAATYRMVISTLGFTAFYHVIPGAPYPFGSFYYTFLVAYFCMYALAAPISVVSAKRNAPLIASLAGISFSTLSGFVDFPLWMKHLSFGFYTAQSIHLANDEVIATAMTSSYEKWGYTDTHPGWNALINLVWGSAFFGLGFVLLVNYNRDRQR